MQIVIEIDEEKYSYVKGQVEKGIDNPLKVIIANGTPLPKGHGRLIDADETISNICGSSCGCHLEECGNDNPCYSVTRIKSAQTIIEADGGRCGMSDKQKLEKIRQTLYNLDEEVADKKVTRDYWEGFCKVFNAVEEVLNENSD